MNILKLRIPILASILITLLMMTGCNYKKVDQRQMPDGAKAKARKNIEEGKGVSIGGLGKRLGKTSYEFSTSNPMWRASLETLDFLPLTTVDYSGGVIISDWYNDSANKDDSIKITVRFLSNEILSNSLKIIVHKKSCDANNRCQINIIDSKIREELVKAILSRAAVFEKEKKKKK